MSREKEYITCLNCGNIKAVVIFHPKTGKRVGYHCPCIEPGRDTKSNPKQNSGTKNEEPLIGYANDDVINSILKSFEAKDKKK